MVRTSSSLIAVTNGDYLIQARDVYRPELPKGNYTFIFPGAYSLFGGAIEEGETSKQAFERELQQELPGLILPKNLGHRVYNWEKQLYEVLERINETFHGNVEAFLGFSLNALVPSCAVGKNKELFKGKLPTYREWITRSTEDNFYVCELSKESLDGIKIMEGQRALWLSHDIIKALVMVPTDKLAVLDDIISRIKSGEIKLA